jgi:hypothetical protein
MPMMHIDVGAILHTSHDGLYTDLVTRATGRTVRTQIEEHMAAGGPGMLSVIDFSKVGLLDFSCADEIVATLMRQCADSSADHYLLFAGITDGHLDAIEHVLEKHNLALVVRFTGLGTLRLVGVVNEMERRVWEAVVRLQPAPPSHIAAEAGLEEEEARACLGALHRRHLLMKDGATYLAPVSAVA